MKNIYYSLLLFFIVTQISAQTGIGTLNPTHSLDINGNTNIRVTKFLPVTASLDSIGAIGSLGVLYKTNATSILEKKSSKLVRISAVKDGSSTLNVPNDTDVTVSDWSDLFVVNANATVWNPATGFFTVPVAGFYKVSAALLFSSDVNVLDNKFSVKIFKKVGAVAPVLVTEMPNFKAEGTSRVNTGVVTTVVACNVGDIISIGAFQNSGITRTISVTSLTLTNLVIEQL